MSELPPKEINFEESMRGSNNTAMLVARSNAIQEYANLEQALCLLFAHLSGTSRQVAGVIFFRLTNANSRLAIIDKLMRLKHGEAYRIFFNSLVAILKPFDGKRNEIVHWHALATICLDETGGKAVMALAPPNYWAHDENTPTLSVDDLTAFDLKADFLARCLNVFTVTALMGATPLAPAWRDIFEQPLVYPPPAGHPGIHPIRGRQGPPGSSQV